jgi:hypothetical protein
MLGNEAARRALPAADRGIGLKLSRRDDLLAAFDCQLRGSTWSFLGSRGALRQMSALPTFHWTWMMSARTLRILQLLAEEEAKLVALNDPPANRRQG